MADFLYHLFIGFESPKQHEEKKDAEDEKGAEPVNTHTTDFLQVINKFHNDPVKRL